MYTTVGRSAKDCCLHEHETRDEAQKCLLQHQNDMRKLQKVSFRNIIEFDTSLEDFLDDIKLIS